MMHSQHHHTAACKDPRAQEGMMLGMTRLSGDTLRRSRQPAKRKAAWTLSLRLHMGQGCPTRYPSNTGAAVCIACVTDAAAAQPAPLARQHHGSGDARHDAVRKKAKQPAQWPCQQPTQRPGHKAIMPAAEAPARCKQQRCSCKRRIGLQPAHRVVMWCGACSKARATSRCMHAGQLSVCRHAHGRGWNRVPGLG